MSSDKSDLEDSDDDLKHVKKGGKKRKSKSKTRDRKDADRKGNLKHNIKAEKLHKYKSEEQEAFDDKEKRSYFSDEDKAEKKLSTGKHVGVSATLKDANMAIQGVRKVSGEIEEEQHRGMKAPDAMHGAEKKAHHKKKTAVAQQDDDNSDYSEDLHKNIQKATKKNLNDAEKMRNKTKKADYSSDKEDKNDDSKEVKSIGEKLKQLKLADSSIKKDLDNGTSKGATSE